MKNKKAESPLVARRCHWQSLSPPGQICLRTRGLPAPCSRGSHFSCVFRPGLSRARRFYPSMETWTDLGKGPCLVRTSQRSQGTMLLRGVGGFCTAALGMSRRFFTFYNGTRKGKSIVWSFSAPNRSRILRSDSPMRASSPRSFSRVDSCGSCPT